VGRFIATLDWPRRPDAICLAKHLGGGLTPISTMLTTQAVFQKAYGRDFEEGESHNTTFGNNGLGAVAALAALDVLSEPFLASIREKGTRFRAMLTEALTGNPLFVEVRGEGMISGVQLRDPGHPWLSWEHFGFPGIERPVLAAILCQRLFKHGFYCFVCGHEWGVLRLQPRFEIPEETLARFVRACADELRLLAEVA
jgi:acetylornithine/succinyldiaminopimelate/putrescine aminotransferase